MSSTDVNGIKLVKLGAILALAFAIGGQENAKQLGMTIAFVAAMYVLDVFPASQPAPNRGKNGRSKRQAAVLNHNYPVNAAVIGVDDLGRITTWNAAAEQVTEHKAADVLGKNLGVTLFGQDDVRGTRESLKAVLDATQGGASTDNFEIVLKTGSGRMLTLLVSASPCHAAPDGTAGTDSAGNDDGAEIVGSMLVALDITSRKRSEAGIDLFASSIS